MLVSKKEMEVLHDVESLNDYTPYLYDQIFTIIKVRPDMTEVDVDASIGHRCSGGDRLVWHRFRLVPCRIPLKEDTDFV
jgi:hypothetical protein